MWIRTQNKDRLIECNAFEIQDKYDTNKFEEKYIKATVVDHITPHRGDKKLFWDEDNWQPLCKRCHDKKTMTEDRYKSYKY